jgi:hypothetical protein
MQEPVNIDTNPLEVLKFTLSIMEKHIEMSSDLVPLIDLNNEPQTYPLKSLSEIPINSDFLTIDLAPSQKLTFSTALSQFFQDFSKLSPVKPNPFDEFNDSNSTPTPPPFFQQSPLFQDLPIKGKINSSKDNKDSVSEVCSCQSFPIFPQTLPMPKSIQNTADSVPVETLHSSLSCNTIIMQESMFEIKLEDSVNFAPSTAISSADYLEGKNYVLNSEKAGQGKQDDREENSSEDEFMLLPESVIIYTNQEDIMDPKLNMRIAGLIRENEKGWIDKLKEEKSDSDNDDYQIL